MRKDIKYSGYSATPSDYECLDGELATSLGLINEDGSLKPLFSGETRYQFNKGERLLYIHNVSQHTNYIVLNNGTLYNYQYIGTEQRTMDEIYASLGNVLKVISIGNTLVVLDEEGIIQYFLWKDSGYKYLGSQLPELNASPYIETHIYDSTEMDLIYGVEFDEESSSVILSGSEDWLNTDETKKLYSAKTTSIALYGATRNNVYNRVFARLNMFERILRRKGFVTSPFYVRFAYRLYDGSHAMHTVPVLLVPNTWGKPLTNVHIYESGKVTFDPLISAARLTADITLPDDISNWSDIITHIDIFITAAAVNYSDSAEALVSLSQLPYVSYDAENKWQFNEDKLPMLMSNDHKWKSIIEEYNEQVKYKYYLEQIKYIKEGTSFSLPSNKMIAVDVSMGPVTIYDASGIAMAPIDNYGNSIGLPLPKNGLFDVYLSNYGGGVYSSAGPNTTIRIYEVYTSEELGRNQCYHQIELRRIDGKDFSDVVADCNLFYHISEFDLKTFGTDFSGQIPIKEEVLVNLETKNTLDDTGQCRCKNIVSYPFSYNNRLNIIVDSEKLPSCSDIKVQNPASAPNHLITIQPQYTAAYVKVVENSQICYYRMPLDGSVYFLTYFAYPRSTATELILCSSNIQFRITLQKHPFLNLAYAFNMFQELEGEVITGSFESFYGDVVKFGNKIKISSVNNPFHFSEENTSDLPVNKIYALSTAAKALSEGQFGQFPLYAFTNDGVWALEVSNTGVYSARQPITRDVVINVDSITQIDSAVLFATDRGIMLLSGSTVECISDSINNADELFRITDLPKSDALMNIFNMKSGTGLSVDDITLFPFIDFIKRCRMVYDYTNQHIILYNSAVKYAYVFSLKSKYWGMILSDISYNVNSYPEALAVTTDNRLVDFSKSDVNTVAALAVTRPFVIDDPNTFKTINTIIQRGMFRSTHVRQVLYGSNDLYHWHAVWSSVDRLMRGFRGTPYKAYRLALICNFDKGESISGFTVVFEPRMTNQVR